MLLRSVVISGAVIAAGAAYVQGPNRRSAMGRASMGSRATLTLTPKTTTDTLPDEVSAGQTARFSYVVEAELQSLENGEPLPDSGCLT